MPAGRARRLTRAVRQTESPRPAIPSRPLRCSAPPCQRIAATAFLLPAACCPLPVHQLRSAAARRPSRLPSRPRLGKDEAYPTEDTMTHARAARKE
jgi:hypothetical protein